MAKDSKKNLEKLQAKIQELEAQNKEYLEGWQRAKADYVNLKKETENNHSELVKFANAGLIMELLPVMNHFKEAYKHLPDDLEGHEWAVGIGHIKKLLEDFLQTQGVEEIKTVGEKFDPVYHEAIEKRKEEGTEEDIILEEKVPGYMMQGKVIMPAKVIINQ